MGSPPRAAPGAPQAPRWTNCSSSLLQFSPVQTLEWAPLVQPEAELGFSTLTVLNPKLPCNSLTQWLHTEVKQVLSYPPPSFCHPDRTSL